MIYAGGESSRVYVGRWTVIVYFIDGMGIPRWAETAPGSYESCAAMIRTFGPPDSASWYGYRVERACISRPAPEV